MPATARSDFRDGAGRMASPFGSLRLASTNALKTCAGCAATTRGWITPAGNLVCGICYTPLDGRASKRSRRRDERKLRRALRGAEERDYAEYKRELRLRERRGENGEDVSERDIDNEWVRSDPGYPLGIGMPPGRSLRADGQSHRQGWADLVRADPCSYCGRSRGGTVDHVTPRSRRGRDVWANYTSACEPCNRSKGDTPLLLWLARRTVLT